MNLLLTLLKFEMMLPLLVHFPHNGDRQIVTTYSAHGISSYTLIYREDSDALKKNHTISQMPTR